MYFSEEKGIMTIGSNIMEVKDLKKKKFVQVLVFVVLGLAALAVYYYVTIPAINIHSSGTWAAMMLLLVLLLALLVGRDMCSGASSSN